MSYDDLKEHDIFLPETEWGRLDLTTSVNLPALVLILVLGVASCILMIAGGGHLLTWIGAGLFIVFMLGFALVSNAGINRQVHKIQELHAPKEDSEPR